MESTELMAQFAGVVAAVFAASHAFIFFLRALVVLFRSLSKFSTWVGPRTSFTKADDYMAEHMPAWADAISGFADGCESWILKLENQTTGAMAKAKTTPLKPMEKKT